MAPARTRVWPLLVFVVIALGVLVWWNSTDDEDRRQLTAYLTLGARQRQGGAAIYDDPLAELLAAEQLGVWARLCLLLGRHLASDDSLIRHRIVDQLLRSGGCTASQQGRWLVLSIGAGFDTRPCRLSAVLGAGCAAPALWIEVDHAAVVSLKQRLLSDCGHALRLALPPGEGEQLAAIAQQLPAYQPLDRVDVLLEGVWTYLLPPEKRRLLDTLQRLYPRHRLVVDLLPDHAVPWPSAALSRALGAPWQPAGQLPQLFFLARGYRLAAMHSRDDHGRQLPHTGYAVFVFDWGG